MGSEPPNNEDGDGAYCLLGIFGAFMPLIYGEGKVNALRRLRKEINEPFQKVGIHKSIY